MDQESAVASTDKLETIGKIENWIFYFLCGYALFSSVSMAGANVFLGLVTLTAIIRLIKKHDDWREKLRIDKQLLIPFGIMVGIFALTSIFSTDLLKSVDVLSNHYVNRMIPFFCVLMFIRDKRKIFLLGILAGISFLVNNIACIAQWHNLFGGHAHDRTGGFIGTMMAAGIDSMWVPVLALLMATLKSKSRYVVGVVFVITTVGTIYNGTRGAWLAILLSIVIVVFLYIREKTKALAVILALVMGVCLMVGNIDWMSSRAHTIMNPSADNSANERLLLWESARNMATDYPITGVGYGCFGKNYQDKYILPNAVYRDLGHAHSNFFHVLGENGYPGAVAVCFWWFGTIVYCIKGWIKYNNIGYLTILAIFLGVMLQGVTEYTMGDSIVMKLFWFGVGLSYQWIKLNTDNE